MRRFTFEDAKSSKFWEIELSAETVTVRFGRLGTDGQTKAKEFPDAAAARKDHDKKIAEKLKKGYVEESGGAPAAPAKKTPGTEAKATKTVSARKKPATTKKATPKKKAASKKEPAAKKSARRAKAKKGATPSEVIAAIDAFVATTRGREVVAACESADVLELDALRGHIQALPERALPLDQLLPEPDEFPGEIYRWSATALVALLAMREATSSDPGTETIAGDLEVGGEDIRIVPGDLSVDGALFCHGALLVAGGLSVTGPISIEEGAHVSIGGAVRCRSALVNSAIIAVGGPVDVELAVFHYNHGIALLAGGIEAKLVIEDDQSVEIAGAVKVDAARAWELKLPGARALSHDEVVERLRPILVEELAADLPPTDPMEDDDAPHGLAEVLVKHVSEHGRILASDPKPAEAVDESSDIDAAAVVKAAFRAGLEGWDRPSKAALRDLPLIPEATRLELARAHFEKGKKKKEKDIDTAFGILALGRGGADWCRELWEALPPHAVGRQAVTALAATLPADEALALAWGAVERVDEGEVDHRIAALESLRSPAVLDVIEDIGVVRGCDDGTQRWDDLARRSMLTWSRVRRWLVSGPPLERLGLRCIDAIRQIDEAGDQFGHPTIDELREVVSEEQMPDPGLLVRATRSATPDDGLAPPIDAAALDALDPWRALALAARAVERALPAALLPPKLEHPDDTAKSFSPIPTDGEPGAWLASTVERARDAAAAQDIDEERSSEDAEARRQRSRLTNQHKQTSVPAHLVSSAVDALSDRLAGSDDDAALANAISDAALAAEYATIGPALGTRPPREPVTSARRKADVRDAFRAARAADRAWLAENRAPEPAFFDRPLWDPAEPTIWAEVVAEFADFERERIEGRRTAPKPAASSAFPRCPECNASVFDFHTVCPKCDTPLK